MELLFLSGLSIMYLQKSLNNNNNDNNTNTNTLEDLKSEFNWIDLIKNIPDIKVEKNNLIQEKKDYFNDTNREIKSICTDIVVNDFFSTKESLYKFLFTVYKIFEHVINLYIKHNNLKRNDIFFTFKGGNILRIISKEFILELPNYASEKIKDYYSKFFKRSDADFSIYINPELKNYEIIHDDLCKLSYHIQDYIRNLIQNNLQEFFDFFKYNDEYKKKILQKNLDILNKAESLKDISNIRYNQGKFLNLTFDNISTDNKDIYNYRKDFFSDFIKSEKNNKNIKKSDINNKNNKFMFISINKTLEFKSNIGDLTKFSLIRTKINFNTILLKDNKKTRLNIAGELIDVSIPHKKDKSVYNIFKNFDKAISRYTMKLNNEILSFNSYSLEFLIEDLEKILFYNAEYPWSDNKYKKRLNRLLYLYFLQMFIEVQSNKKRKNIIINIKKTFIKDINIYSGPKKKKKNFNSKHEKDYLKNIKNINRIEYFYSWQIEKILENDYIFIFKKELNNFSNIILENLNILEEAFDDIEIYCEKQQPFEEESIYKGNINNLI